MSGLLVVLSGLPGTGKSTVGDLLAPWIDAERLSVDDAEDALLAAGHPPGFETGVAAYEAVRAAAEERLVAGRSVVVDAVNDGPEARGTWVRAARAADADLRAVLLAPPAGGRHRARLEGRRRDLRLVPEPTWRQVVLRRFEPWPGAPVVSTDGPAEQVARAVLALLRQPAAEYFAAGRPTAP